MGPLLPPALTLAPSESVEEKSQGNLLKNVSFHATGKENRFREGGRGGIQGGKFFEEKAFDG